MKEMGNRIREKRIEMGLTMSELGDKVGLQSSAINKYEHGDIKYIERDRIAKLAEVFHVSPSWLMFGDDKDVTLTYQAPGKEPIMAIELHKSAPIVGDSAKRAALYSAALNVPSQNLDVAIELLKSLSETEKDKKS